MRVGSGAVPGEQTQGDRSVSVPYEREHQDTTAIDTLGRTPVGQFLKPIGSLSSQEIRNKQNELVRKKLVLQGDRTNTQGKDLSNARLQKAHSDLEAATKGLEKYGLFSRLFKSKKHTNLLVAKDKAEREIQYLNTERDKLGIGPDDTPDRYNLIFQALESHRDKAVAREQASRMAFQDPDVVASPFQKALNEILVENRTVEERYACQTEIFRQFEAAPKDPRLPEWKNWGELGRRTQELGKIAAQIRNRDLVPDTYLEYLSHEIAYEELQVGMLLPGRLPGQFYEVTKAFTNDAGLVAYALESPGGKEPPILLFRGTDPQNIAHLRLDIDPDIGLNAISASKKELSDWLASRKQKAVLTGHSLGGAKAQQLAVLHPENIGSVVTFCSPGVKRETAQQFSNKARGVDVRHYVTENDPVSWFGDTPIDGKLITLSGKYPIAAAHVANTLRERRPGIDRTSVVNVNSATRQATMLEWLRQQDSAQKNLRELIDKREQKSKESPKPNILPRDDYLNQIKLNMTQSQRSG